MHVFMIAYLRVQHKFSSILFHVCCTDTCQECGHVIATHEYTFEVDDEFQACIFINNLNYHY